MATENTMDFLIIIFKEQLYQGHHIRFNKDTDSIKGRVIPSYTAPAALD